MTTPAASGWNGMRLVLLDGHGKPQMLLNGLTVTSADVKRPDGKSDTAQP
jgi:hypothetical protein